MSDWQHYWRDLQERPLFYPLFKVYSSFMNIKRYEHMPYYFYPSGVSVVKLEDRVINFLDWMCDAHEEARNPHDKNHSFYSRAVFVYKNFMRYSNPTVCNIMFDTQATRPEYDRLNSIITSQTRSFYLAAVAVHSVAFMYMSFFFRYRRLGAMPTFFVASAYYYAFGMVNDILYSSFVDKRIVQEAKIMGLGQHAQPVNTRKNRGFNFI
jgi:hypothetical protein